MSSFPDYIPPSSPLKVKPPLLDYQDPSSHSYPGQYFTDHIHLDFTIDFTKKLLDAKATYTVRLVGGMKHLVLDIRGITIKSVTTGANDTPLKYSITNTDSFVGFALRIELGNIVHRDIETFQISITYTTPGNGDGHGAGGALDWLNGEQTASNEVFAFTQCQAIHARSILPCQDTPTVKSTYTALVKVAAPYEHLTVVMSAQRVPLLEGETGARFKCDVPVPSYLIAFACGLLEYKRLSHRSVVWAEPSVVEDAEWEFKEVEEMLTTAEDISGPYVWGRYDLLVLPGSFPYGGYVSFLFQSSSITSCCISCF